MAWNRHGTGPQDDNPPVAGTIIPGKYGATVVAKIDNDKRTIVFAAKYGKKGKRYRSRPSPTRSGTS